MTLFRHQYTFQTCVRDTRHQAVAGKKDQLQKLVLEPTHHLQTACRWYGRLKSTAASNRTHVTFSGTLTSCLIYCSSAGTWPPSLQTDICSSLFTDYLFGDSLNLLQCRTRQMFMFSDKFDKREILALKLCWLQMLVVVQSLWLLFCVAGC